MADIIEVTDLPSAIQAAELVDLMVAGANANASRVAPCLVDPTSTDWVTATAYAVGDQARLADGEFVEATVAGTSGATPPTVPSVIGGTVVDGTVTWERIAPSGDQLAEAKLVLVGAVKRWHETGAGALQSQQAGPFAQAIDTRQRTGFNLWPSEIESLQEICTAAGSGGSGRAFEVDTMPADAGVYGVDYWWSSPTDRASF